MKRLWFKLLSFLLIKSGGHLYYEALYGREKSRADREKERADKNWRDGRALIGEICKRDRKLERTKAFAQAQVVRIKDLKEQIAKDRAYVRELKQTIAGMERVL